MNWQIFPVRSLKDNYIWTIKNDLNEAIIVDPGAALPVLDNLTQNGLTLKGILITHKHWDHTNGILEITNRLPVPVYAPRHDATEGATELMSEGDEIDLASFPKLTVIDIPGHTLGHIAYTGEGILFSGDTLFSAGCGRVFEGTPTQMLASLKKLVSLPHDTLMYCGHEYTQNNLRFAEKVEPNNESIKDRVREVNELRQQGMPSLPVSLKVELKTNPFLRCQYPDVIKSVEAYAGKKLHTETAVFTVLRAWKDQF